MSWGQVTPQWSVWGKQVTMGDTYTLLWAKRVVFIVNLLRCTYTPCSSYALSSNEYYEVDHVPHTCSIPGCWTMHKLQNLPGLTAIALCCTNKIIDVTSSTEAQHGTLYYIYTAIKELWTKQLNVHHVFLWWYEQHLTSVCCVSC